RLRAGELPGDLLHLPGRDALEVHLQDRLLHTPAHAAVALEDLRQEGHLAGAGDADLLDVAGRRGEPPTVVAVALAETLLGPLAVLGLELGRHLLLHDLLQHTL